MPKKSQRSPTAASAPQKNTQVSSTSKAAQVQPDPPKSKAEEAKKSKKGNAKPQPAAASKTPKKLEKPQIKDQHKALAQPSNQKGNCLETPESSKQVNLNGGAGPSKKLEIPQSKEPNQSVAQPSNQEGKSLDTTGSSKQANSKLSSTSSQEVASGSSILNSTLPIRSGSSIKHEQGTQSRPSSHPEALSIDTEIFRLAAATPVPISPTIERQFYESQLLLYVLERVRGEHKKRQNYHGELDQDRTELRRSFVDKLAYICDFKKGGSTVTALALQQTPQGVTFWIAANETVKSKVIEFLQQILRMLKKVEGTSRENIEAQLLSLIVPFNKDRLDYYWSALQNHLGTCTKRLDDLERSTDDKTFARELRVLRSLLASLPALSKMSADMVSLVRECFESRKARREKLSAFETLAHLTASGNSNGGFFDDIRHLLGRLGEHLKATKTIVSAALRFPEILDDFEIKVCASPPSRCYYQSPDSITLDGMASRIFTRDDEIPHYQEALETLERTSNGALLESLRRECTFKTRVHAELLLVDHFYWRQFDFVGDDPYIGCSKPACFNCHQYILVHPGNFELPACHNKLYLRWRTPDIVEEGVPVELASKIREGITSRINSNTRVELRRQIDGRFAKRAARYDSVTGTSSSINVPDLLLPPVGMSQDGEDSSYASAEEYLASSGDPPSGYPSREDSEMGDSDDDLTWYQSRVKKIRTSVFEDRAMRFEQANDTMEEHV